MLVVLTKTLVPHIATKLTVVFNQYFGRDSQSVFRV